MEIAKRVRDVDIDGEGPATKTVKIEIGSIRGADGDETMDARTSAGSLKPLAEFFTVHKAIRRNLEVFNGKLMALTASCTEQMFEEVIAHLIYLKRMMDRHCESEEEILCPAIRQKLTSDCQKDSKARQNFFSHWHGHHNDVNDHFDVIVDKIRHLKRQCMQRKGADVDFSQALSQLKNEQTVALRTSILKHFEDEESTLLPLFGEFFTVAEQGALLVQTLVVLFAAPLLPWTVRALSGKERIDFLKLVQTYSSEEQLAEIAGCIAHDLSSSEWRALCKALPELERAAKVKATPLIEITHIHKAIRCELRDLVKFCRNLDPCDDAQLHSLSIRFKFLRSVHSCHSAGEDQVIIKELKERLYNENDKPPDIHEQHDDEAAIFVALGVKLEGMIAVKKELRSGRNAEKEELVEMMDRFADHLLHHMEDEETNILPLVQKYFSVEDQDQMVRRAMAKVPSDFLSELIHWCLAALSIDEQEKLLRNVLRTSPEDEFRKIALVVASSVQKGEKRRCEWDELCLRIPELHEQSNGAAETGAFSEGSPINEILRVHKAIRIELQAILEASLDLAESPNPNSVTALAERCSFLRRMVHFHSKAEDSIVLPLIEKRIANTTQSYQDEHSDERRLFATLAKHLETLQCSGDGEIAMSVYVVARTLRDDMLHHLKMEETHLWPLLEQNFTEEEQSEVVSMIFGQMPSEILQEMLPWMIRVLSASERDEMMNHIYAVTGSTLFEKWLQTWFPHPKEGNNEAEAKSKPNANTEHLEEGAAVALVLLQGKEDVQRAVRLVAADQSLTPEQKSRLMQSLLQAKWMQNNSNEPVFSKVPPEDRAKSYIYTSDKKRTLGCEHYQRKCKIRAKCCGRLYTCRLCHDAVNSHTMNRYQTEEVWCMQCDTLQPVAERCRSCNERFSRYFCSVCRLYDENESRDVYHCHSCNVCRVGKGLGIDFFHCMRCNACISLKRRNHKCIEKVMESNCPICNNYLFSSTTPIQYLSCGHLMHRQCYDQYSKRSMRCPVCQQSLSDMTSHVDRLNLMLAQERMPAEYRVARARVRCYDCRRETSVPFHFFRLRCANCQSYNTHMLQVDPNGGDLHLLRRNQRS